MRTVFTDAQVRQLEALFDLTDYPPAEARAELAKSSGLSEETVRVGLRDVTVAFTSIFKKIQICSCEKM